MGRSGSGGATLPFTSKGWEFKPHKLIKADNIISTSTGQDLILSNYKEMIYIVVDVNWHLLSQLAQNKKSKKYIMVYNLNFTHIVTQLGNGKFH